eukprot:360471-Ditylum_brightwellii.AAC.1
MSNKRQSQHFPQNIPKNPLLPKQQQKHNNQQSGAFTGTIRTQSSHCHCHHGDAVPLSDAGATLLVPKPGNSTNDTGGL